MRVVQVTPRYPPHAGGVENHVREISERLVERGIDVTVLTADASPDLPRRETRNGVEVRRHRSLAPNGAFHFAPGTVRSVRNLDADAVHAHNYHSFPLLFAALGRTDERFVATPHYHGRSESAVRDRLLALYRPLGRWALRQADAVVAVSEWEQEQLRSDFGLESRVVPNGLNVERFANADGEQRDRPYVLTVGRLEEYKGVQHLVRAMPRLEEYELVVAGEGPHGDELRQLVETVGVSDQVTFLGYVDDDRLPSLYAGAAVYATLSTTEAYGMTVAEAIASGTPCTVLATGALERWTDNEGVVGVDATDPETVSRAVDQAQGLDPDVGELDDWDDVVARLSRVLEG